MSESLVQRVKSWAARWGEAWSSFWFVEREAHALAVIRIACGGMLAYIHLIWLIRLSDFLGPNAWIDRDSIQTIHQNDWAWSWLFYTDSPWLTGAHETIALLASLMMMLGLLTRVAIPVAWFFTLMTCHRLTLSLFGLDQIVVMLAMYLMLANSGAVWSMDRRLFSASKSASGDPRWWIALSKRTVNNNIATRLIQIHLCVIYLFGGLGKMRGEMWYEGSAMWFTIVNYEYQSLDLTWIGKSPMLIATLSATTIFWETFYCALVWPKLTRPLVLATAFFVHAGIAIGLGMVTFGVIMIVANFAFIDPAVFRHLFERSKLEKA
ncbi:MAG: HTTM domain-containing protein [Planctomycetota bacterium]